MPEVPRGSSRTWRPIVHLLIGAGAGFYAWSKTQSALFAFLSDAAPAPQPLPEARPALA